MDDDELRQLLEQLHKEIERTHSVDKKGRELLQHLGADINELLAREGGVPAQAQPNMIERLEESIDHYEISHPDLTMLLAKVLSTLSNAGI